MKRVLIKRTILSLLAVAFGVALVRSVSAQNFQIEYIFNRVGEAIGSIFAPIFGVSATSEFLFAKIMLFFLLFSIVFMVLKKMDLFKDNKVIPIIVALIFSIFAVRYLKETEFIRAILLPYTSAGAAIATFLPLLIFFYFVHASDIGPFGRKAAWFIYGAFFLVLWLSRDYSELKTANWIYFLGIGFILICFVFDSHLHEYFEVGKANKARREILKGVYADYMDKLRKAEEAGLTDVANDFKRKIKRIARKM